MEKPLTWRQSSPQRIPTVTSHSPLPLRPIGPPLNTVLRSSVQRVLIVLCD